MVCELSRWCHDVLTPSDMLTGKHIDRVSKYLQEIRQEDTQDDTKITSSNIFKYIYILKIKVCFRYFFTSTRLLVLLE